MLDVAFCFLSVLDLNFKDVVIEIKTVTLCMTREEPIFLSPRFYITVTAIRRILGWDGCGMGLGEGCRGWGWMGGRV